VREIERLGCVIWVCPSVLRCDRHHFNSHFATLEKRSFYRNSSIFSTKRVRVVWLSVPLHILC
jgi:hypothetical protein